MSEEKFAVTVEIAWERIADMMSTAFESGSRYWLPSVTANEATAKTTPDGDPWYCSAAYWAGTGVTVFHEMTDEATEETTAHRIGRKQLMEGIERLAVKCPYMFGMLIDSEKNPLDANQADECLQWIVLGESRYG